MVALGTKNNSPSGLNEIAVGVGEEKRYDYPQNTQNFYVKTGESLYLYVRKIFKMKLLDFCKQFDGEEACEKHL
ncbi:MAG: hypothetical protein MR215_07595, partial [Bacteroidales bacterium]|nr:hypothetical protein [Bacteroidales bacterium]